MQKKKGMIWNLTRLLWLSGNSAYSYYLSVRLFCAYADPEGSFLTRSRHLIDNHFIYFWPPVTEIFPDHARIVTFPFIYFPQISFHGKNCQKWMESQICNVLYFIAIFQKRITKPMSSWYVHEFIFSDRILYIIIIFDI